MHAHAHMRPLADTAYWRSGAGAQRVPRLPLCSPARQRCSLEYRHTAEAQHFRAPTTARVRLDCSTPWLLDGCACVCWRAAAGRLGGRGLQCGCRFGHRWQRSRLHAEPHSTGCRTASNATQPPLGDAARADRAECKVSGALTAARPSLALRAVCRFASRRAAGSGCTRMAEVRHSFAEGSAQTNKQTTRANRDATPRDAAPARDHYRRTCGLPPPPPLRGQSAIEGTRRKRLGSRALRAPPPRPLQAAAPFRWRAPQRTRARALA
jgi:hypothetical protein